VNIWLIGATVLCVTVFLPGLVAASRGDSMERLMGLQLVTSTTVAVLVLIAHGLGRAVYLDTALVLAVLSLAGGLVFARFLGKSL